MEDRHSRSGTLQMQVRALLSHLFMVSVCVWRALGSFTRARSFKCFTCFANNYEKWSNYIHSVWNEQKKCSLCTMETLPVHVFSQCCSTLPFFTEDCLLWKYLFYFPLSEDFPSCMNSPVEGETHYSASLHFCAFGLLECIVNNQRNKGTGMGRGERSEVQSELVVHFRQLWPFHSCTSLWGCSAPRGCCSSAGGWMAWGLSLARSLAGPTRGCCAARHMGGLSCVYASIKDLWKLNCSKLHGTSSLGPFLQTE